MQNLKVTNASMAGILYRYVHHCCAFSVSKVKQSQHQSKPPSQYTEVMINVEICISFNSFIIINTSEDDRKRLWQYSHVFILS